MHAGHSHGDRAIADTPLASWSAVASVGVGAFALVTTEFLPVGLLPQIAADIGVTEGQAGLMVTIPGVLAAMAGPLTTALAGRIDRRYVLWVLLGLLVVSNLLVAFAPNLPVLLGARLLLGGALVQSVDWHWIFTVNVPIGIAVLLAGWRLIDDRPGIGLRGGLDIGGSFLITAAWYCAPSPNNPTAKITYISAEILRNALLARPQSTQCLMSA